MTKFMRFAVALLLFLHPLVPVFAQSAPTNPSSRDPDPTVLTTQASEKAVAALKELIMARLDSLEQELKKQNETLQGQDARLILRMDNVGGDIEKQIAHLRTLMDEKFTGVGQQFAGRDVALAAALLAQKTSVDEQNKANAASSAKSESATTKQIDGITGVITASQKGNDDKIEALKVLLGAQKQATDASIVNLKDSIAASDSRASIERTSVLSRTEGGSSAINVIILVVSMGFGLLGAIASGFAIAKASHKPQVERIYVSDNGNGNGNGNGKRKS